MFKGLLLLCGSALIFSQAIILSQSLPDGLEDHSLVQLQLNIITLMRMVFNVVEYLGFGSFYSNIWHLQKIELNREPVTAAYGDLKVIRDTIYGVPVIIYQPLNTSKLYPAIIYFHGGGWTIGGPDVYDKTAYDYANQTRTILFNVGYRLAPQHPFPAPLQDCYDVVKFILNHGARYNVDVTKVGVVGDSSGANLAAAVTLRLLKEAADLPPLMFQVLHCPAMQALNLQLPSYLEFENKMPLLPADVMIAYYAYYMGLDAENMYKYVKVISENRHVPLDVQRYEYVDVKLLPEVYKRPRKQNQTVTSTLDINVYEKIKNVVTNPLFSPLLAPDLSEMPQTMVHVCEFDILRDDALMFAARLQEAGVKVQVHFGKGGFHGDIINLTDLFHSSSGKKALSVAYTFIHGILEY